MTFHHFPTEKRAKNEETLWCVRGAGKSVLSAPRTATYAVFTSLARKAQPKNILTPFPSQLVEIKYVKR